LYSPFNEIIQNCSNKFRFQRDNFEDVNAAANWHGGYDAQSDDDDNGDEYGYGAQPFVQLYWVESLRQDYELISQMVSTL
jgi:hypothetical protein